MSAKVKEMDSDCGYCLELIQSDEDDSMSCEECLKKFHVKCLKNKTPGDLQGDIFFKFTCSNCNANDEEDNDKELFVRTKMLW